MIYSVFPWPIDEEEEQDDREDEHLKTGSSPSIDLKSKFALSGVPMCFLVLLLPKFIQEEVLSMSIFLSNFTPN